MFWNKKKNTSKNEKILEDELTKIDETDDEVNELEEDLDFDEDIEEQNEELNDIKNEDDEIDFNILKELDLLDSDDDYDDDGIDDDDENDEKVNDEKEKSDNEIDENEEKKSKVLISITSLDMFADFVNNKNPGVLQFMIKESQQVFELRESHFRMAEVLGVVMMAKECTPIELERIHLAKELLDEPEKFYVIPTLNEKDVAQDFCDDNFGENGKKYAKNPKKFIRMIEENDLFNDWKAYTKAAVFSILEKFCEKHNIEFSEE